MVALIANFILNLTVNAIDKFLSGVRNQWRFLTNSFIKCQKEWFKLLIAQPNSQALNADALVLRSKPTISFYVNRLLIRRGLEKLRDGDVERRSQQV